MSIYTADIYLQQIDRWLFNLEIEADGLLEALEVFRSIARAWDAPKPETCVFCFGVRS